MNSKAETQHLLNIAAQIALAELVRIALTELLYHPDRTVFRNRMAKLEDLATSRIEGRQHFPGTSDEIEQFIKTNASAWVTKIITSIAHPEDSHDGILP